MAFNIWAGMLGGFIGTLVMTALMRMSIAAGMTNMPPMPLIQGAMVTDDPDRAKKIGMVTHVIVMGTIMFGIIYAVVFSTLGTAGWLTGLIVGLVHGMLTGLVMKMMGRTHPRMEPVANFTGDETWRHDAAGLHIAEGGWFGKNYGGDDTVRAADGARRVRSRPRCRLRRHRLTAPHRPGNTREEDTDDRTTRRQRREGARGWTVRHRRHDGLEHAGDEAA